MSNGAHVLISLEDNGWNSGTFNVPVDTIGLQCPTGMDYKVGTSTTTTIKVMVKVMVFKTFEGALRLAAGAFFHWRIAFSEKNDISYIAKKTFFCKKCKKNITFELLDHHHELNQKKLILLKFFMLKIDSTMLEL